jgi:hypothetical protein
MTELPTDKVTFLFTDIEGAHRLWEVRPDATRAARAVTMGLSPGRSERTTTNASRRPVTPSAPRSPFAAAWAAGRMLPPEQALTRALAEAE